MSQSTKINKESEILAKISVNKEKVLNNIKSVINTFNGSAEDFSHYLFDMDAWFRMYDGILDTTDAAYEDYFSSQDYQDGLVYTVETELWIKTLKEIAPEEYYSIVVNSDML